MTEEEAKTCWCPFARDSRVVRAENPGGDRSTGFCCIGSACMAWRRGGEQKFRDRRTGKLSDRDMTGNGEWIDVAGYCGLAGLP